MNQESIPLGVRVRLSAMMFFQFMLFAVWWQPLAAYLGKLNLGTTQSSLILSSQAIGCMASPLICMVADRYFASQRVLLVLNVVTAGLLYVAAAQTEGTMVFIALLAAMLCYMPTWALTSAIAMANSPGEKFPQIRVFGSIGWVCSAIFSFVAMQMYATKIDGTNIPLLCGAGTAILAAIVALTPPNTPPPAKGKEASVIDALGLKALTLMKDRHFAFFIIISTLVMIPFTIYWSYCSVFLNDKGFRYISGTMNLGQFAEMFFMLLVPLALTRLGVKWTMILGLLALTVRYACFLVGGMVEGMAWLYFIAILVHGIIFGFFFVGGQVYINRKAPKELQGQAQGLIFLTTFGVGLLVGNFANGALIDAYTKDWSKPGAVNLAKDKQATPSEAGLELDLGPAVRVNQIVVRKPDARITAYKAECLVADKETGKEEWKEAFSSEVTGAEAKAELVDNFQALNASKVRFCVTKTKDDAKLQVSELEVYEKVYDWNTIWTITTVICAVLLAAFLFLFTDTKADQTQEAAQGAAEPKKEA